MAENGYGIDSVIRSLHTLLNTQDPKERAAADEALCHFKASEAAWEVSIHILTHNQDEEILCFGALTLRNKIKADFLLLPASEHESLCSSLFVSIEKFAKKKRILAYLTLALGDLAHLACDSWPDPIGTIFGRFGQNATVAGHPHTFLLLSIFRDYARERSPCWATLDLEKRNKVDDIFHAAKGQLLEVLAEIHRSGDPEIRTKALCCWAEWVRDPPVLTSRFQTDPFFEDCFKILLSPVGGVDLGYVLEEDGVMLHELLSEMLCEILQSAVDTDCGSNPTGAQFCADLLDCVAVRHGGFLEQLAFARETEDVELEQSLAMVLYNAALLKARNFPLECLCEGDWLQILKIFLLIVQQYNPLQADQQIEQTLHLPLLIWFEILDCIGNTPPPNLIAAYTQLAQSIVKHSYLPPPLIYVSSARQTRSNLMTSLPDCAQVLGPAVIIDMISEELKKGSEAVGEVSLQEGLLTCLTALAEDSDRSGITTHEKFEEAQKKFIPFLELFSQGKILAPQPPGTLVDIYCRIEAVRLIRASERPIRMRGDLLGPLIQGVLSHTHFAWAEENDPERKKSLRNLVRCSVEAFLTITETQAMAPEAQPLIPHLINMLRERLVTDNLFVDDKIGIVHGVVNMADRLPDPGALLQVLEIVFEPLIGRLQASNDPVAIAELLDTFAAILRNTRSSRLVTEERIGGTETFVLQAVWPMLKTFLQKFEDNALIVEKVIRCIKHSFRSIGPRFVSHLPEIEYLISNAFEKHKFSSYLYCVEFLLNDAVNHPEAYPILQKLFTRLGLQAFAYVETQMDNLGKIFNVVDDAFGMTIRSLQRCPAMVVGSPVLLHALKVAERAVYEKSSDVVGVVFHFMEVIVCPKKNVDSLVAEQLNKVAIQALPNIIKALFGLILSVPGEYVLRRIADLLWESRNSYKMQCDQLYEEALDSLPAGFYSPPKKAEILAKLKSHRKATARGVRNISSRAFVFLVREKA